MNTPSRRPLARLLAWSVSPHSLIFTLLRGATVALTLASPCRPAQTAESPGLLPAFPGAEGFGAHAVGGRGGKVYVVTTLADYDPLTDPPIAGSFRAAVEAEGPRIVVFAVSGNIELKAQVWLMNRQLTIAGQSAPGDGICLKNFPVILRNEDVIIRYLRFRLGDISGQDGDSLRTAACHNVIIDHCSISWGTAACLRIGRSSANVTVQWCLISEALDALGNGFGAIVSENALSLHHNLFAHNRARSPYPIQGFTEFTNNVVYDWADAAGSSPDNARLWVNFLGNTFQPGPSTARDFRIAFAAGLGVKVFARDNAHAPLAGRATEQPPLFTLADGATLLAVPNTLESSGVNLKLDKPDRGKGLPVTIDSAPRAYENVLAEAGASRPRRDAADARVVQSVRDGTGRLIRSQAEVGGWPELHSIPAPLDRDQDGLPDEWELARGLNPKDSTDSARLDPAGGGYSHIEVYLAALAASAPGSATSARASTAVVATGDSRPETQLRRTPAPAVARPRLRAFPGAEGFGAWTPGGRGGTTQVVTTLADYDPRSEPPIAGSFRAAVEAAGPRTVVFAVSGNIDLKTTIRVRHPYLTIAGQTSPGGICLRSSELEIGRSAHDIIIRYLRWRPGDVYRQQNDGIGLSGCRNVILDHCSVSWANDEVLSATRDTDFLTVQWCIVAEALHRSFHAGGQAHGLGTLIDSPHGSFHHNLYAHNSGRNPRPGDALLDWRNNVVYNWNNTAGYTGLDNVLQINFVGNYLKAGPFTKAGRSLAFSTGSETRIYAAGNFMADHPDATQDNRRMLLVVKNARVESAPFAVEPVATEPALVACEKVLAQAGASKPFRDSVDARIVQSVRDGTGRHIDSQNDVGGWPAMKSLPAPRDSDHDGMPDAWEKAHGLNPDNAADAAGTSANGYTHLENYLNSLSNTSP